MAGVGTTDRLQVAFLDSPFLGPGLALAAVLLAGAVVIALIRRWQQQTANPVGEASDQLSHYQALYEKGEISEEELRVLRRALAGDLSGAPHPAPKAPPSQEGPATPPPPPAEGAGPPPETGIRPT